MLFNKHTKARAHFDERFYRARYPDVAAVKVKPFDHFMKNGWREGRAPNAWFRAPAYLAFYPDLAGQDINPFEHFLENHDPEKAIEVGDAALSLELARSEASRRVAAEFDAEFYIEKYPDVQSADAPPLYHYLTNGWRERRCPVRWFDPKIFYTYCPDQLKRDVDPFGQFLLTYDADDAKRYDQLDLAFAYQDAASRAAVADAFDSAYYLDRNPAARESELDPLLHVLTVGWKEGYDPSPAFSVRFYLDANRDVGAAGLNPLVHYGLVGRRQRRPSETVAGAEVVFAFTERPGLAEALSEAIALEPMVALPQDVRVSSKPTFHHAAFGDAAQRLRRQLEGRRFRFVVLLPGFGSPETSTAAATIIGTLARLCAKSDILVVATDPQTEQDASAFDPEIASLDLAALFGDLELRRRLACLFDLLRGVEAEALVNIGSKLAWDTMEAFGRQLAQEYTILTYLPPVNRAPDGADTGFAVQNLRNTCHHHHCLITATSALADEITERFGFAGDTGQTEILSMEPASTEAAAGRIDDTLREVLTRHGL